MADCYEPCNDVTDICINTGPAGPRGSVGKITQFIFYPSVGDTLITGTDKSGTLLEVDPDGVLVALNGVMLEPTADYTIAADGLSVTLTAAIVNANDVLTVQTWKSDENATNAVLDLKLEIEKNTQGIEGLDVRVSANESDIDALQGLADGITTRNVKVSGVNTQRSVDHTLETQMDVNLFLDASIGDVESRIGEIESGQPDLSSDLEDLRTDIDDNSQGVADNAQSLSDLVTVVESNVEDITSIQNEINALPPAYDDSELTGEVDDIANQVGKNVLAITANAKAISLLGEPVDITPLADSIETNAKSISTNASAISELQTVDAEQTGQINNIKLDVAELQETEFDTTGFAVVDADNEFSVSQTIKDGLKITGTKAFVEMDKGTPLSISNGNFSNAVVDIIRSNGEIAISLEASGHIRGITTDGEDDSSAVSVAYFQANVGSGGGGDLDFSKYATKLELGTEESARILGDQGLADDLAEAILTEKYNDTDIRNKITAEEKARASGDSTLSNKIDAETQYRKDEDEKLQKALEAIEIPDLKGYATEDYVTQATADFATENFVEEAIGAIEIPDNIANKEYVDAQDAINAARIDQGLFDQEKLQDKVTALEGAVGEHSIMLTVTNPDPQIGEFALKEIDGSPELTNSLSVANYILLPHFDSNGNTIHLPRIVPGDVLRLADRTGNFAELKIVENNLGFCEFTKIWGELDTLEVELHDFVLLCSFDPEGMATISYVDDRDAATLAAAQADAAANYLSLQDGGTVESRVNFKEGIHLNGGEGNQFIEAATGFTGKLTYVVSGEPQDCFAWGRNANYSWVPLDMKSNQIINLADPDPTHLQHAATVNYVSTNYLSLNEGGTVNGTVRFNNGIHLTGGADQQIIYASAGVAGSLYYGDQNNVGKKRFSWGSNNCIFFVDVDLKDNKIVNVADPDPSSLQSAVTVNYLNNEIIDAKAYTDSAVVASGSFAKTGTETPSLLAGELFFNTSDKILYIGE